MPLFGFGEADRPSQMLEPLIDSDLEDRLSSLVSSHAPEELQSTEHEVRQAVVQAARSDLRNIKLLGQGRCPECQSRTEFFLYTTLCPACGWYRRAVPDTGHSVVHLDTGERIVCDRVYRVVGDEIMCVKEGVVVNQVMRRFVRRIEYVWSREELAEARRSRRRHEGICSWCEKDLAGIEQGEKRDRSADGILAPFEEYVAFGALQERYVFCGRKCVEAFRRQFPSRVHRNCYERDCRDCRDCVKRYEVSHFRRAVFES